jgi:regulator of replication initiation timing
VIKEVTNNKELQKLTEENTSLKNELDTIKKSLDKFNKATYMKNSDLGSLYDE